MLRIAVLASKNQSDFRSKEYLSAYRAWHETWAEEYANLGDTSPLFSDKFTRQDHIVAVMVGDDCAALSCMKLVDLSTEMGRADSWFTGWPGVVLDRLCTMDPHVLVWSALTVSKAFRGQRYEGLSISKILTAACVRNFSRFTTHSIMVGSTRNSRGINSIVSPFGAQTLMTVNINHEPTDLVYFKRDEIPGFTPEMDRLLDAAWPTNLGPPLKSAA